MKAMFSAIADAFEDPPAETTHADVALLDRALAASKKGVNGMGGAPPTLMPLRPGLRAGSVFIHSKRTQEALPEIAALPATGVPALDAEFRRREEQTVQEMARDFSTFSCAEMAVEMGHAPRCVPKMRAEMRAGMVHAMLTRRRRIAMSPPRFAPRVVAPALRDRPLAPAAWRVSRGSKRANARVRRVRCGGE